MTAVVLRQRPGGAEMAEAVLDGVLWRCTSSRSAYGCLGRVRDALRRSEAKASPSNDGRENNVLRCSMNGADRALLERILDLATSPTLHPSRALDLRAAVALIQAQARQIARDRERSDNDARFAAKSANA